ncbi:hypothetical protein MRX96_015695 [Rhipicephalus microplus]
MALTRERLRRPREEDGPIRPPGTTRPRRQLAWCPGCSRRARTLVGGGKLGSRKGVSGEGWPGTSRRGRLLPPSHHTATAAQRTRSLPALEAVGSRDASPPYTRRRCRSRTPVVALQ